MTPPRFPPNWFQKARLKLRHLQLFAALDEHRNLHRAAASLTMSQPAASKLLGDLEETLGIELFDRHGRGIEPNWYGSLMIRHARMILSELQETGEELNALLAGHSGRVSIGTVMAPAVELVVPVISSLTREHPGLKIAVAVETSDVLAERVHQGVMDFAIGRLPGHFDPTAFEYQEISSEELCFICHDRNPLLALGRPLLAADLSDATWILQPVGTLLRDRVEALFRAEGARLPHRVIESASPVISMAMVAETDSITVFAHALARVFTPSGCCVVMPFHKRFSVEPYGIFWLKDRPLSPGARTVLSAVRAASERKMRGLPDPTTATAAPTPADT
ncbi:transcriptional regulator [Azospirillum thiophilum]|uniref:Transcriptional regulator n=1 Tax=Azospirillum thiophilum TaxID=528244 RepID=A0AAC8W5F4_9PROT|nr:LysR family transcriptional regulator [Azospirillum thiophilum]ALG75329.1 transcriptional regulator [Azospirillum thiophilum]KJR62243.1 transcriptional regulator [Azospirillum thiophilum]